MKRLIAALLLAAGVIAVCVFGSSKVTAVCDRWEQDLEKINEIYAGGDISQARQDADKIFRDFEKDRRVLALFVNHGQLDEISRLLQSLPQEDTDFSATATSAAYLISDLKAEFGYGLEGFF